MGEQHIKSQAAIEFITLVGISLLLFLIMLAVISNNIISLNDKEETIRLDDIAIKIQKEISLASKVQNGYSRRFYLPTRLGNIDYSIIVSGNEVVVRTSKQSSWAIIPNIEGNIAKGPNLIQKKDGKIYLN